MRVAAYLVMAVALQGCGFETAEDLDGAELSDMEARASKAVRLSWFARVCETDDSGAACNSVQDSDDEGASGARLTLIGVLDADATALQPCSMSARARDKDYEFSRSRVQAIPPGAVRAAPGDDGRLEIAVALAVGADLVDPFSSALDPSTYSDHDGDGEPGITFVIGRALGSVWGAMAISMSATAVQLGGEPAPATLHRTDWAVIDDSVPFVNVRKKVDTMLDTRLLLQEDATIELLESAPSCAAALAAFED